MKNMLSPFGSLIAIALLSGACTKPVSCDFTPADRETLTKTHAEATGPAHSDPSAVDWVKFAEAHYTEDAIMMPPNGPEVQGREAIVATMQSWPPITKFHTEDVEIDGSGDLAYIRGVYELDLQVNDSTSVTDKGKYIELWVRNESGVWRCNRDIYNSDLPAGQ